MDLEDFNIIKNIDINGNIEFPSAVWELTQIIKKNNKSTYRRYVSKYKSKNNHISSCAKTILKLHQKLLKILITDSLSSSIETLPMTYNIDDVLHDLCIYVMFYSDSDYEERMELYEIYIKSTSPLVDIIDDILFNNEKLPIYKYYDDPMRKVKALSK